MNLHDWAVRWQLPRQALDELTAVVDRSVAAAGAGDAGGSEAAASTLVRLEASQYGHRLWRNNVGAGSIDGQFLRWGLANDSKGVNAVLKSADLIGIRRVVITPAHVGHVFGQFLSREVKAPGWKFTGTPREVAQRNWAHLINSLGGDAAFCTGRGSLEP